MASGYGGARIWEPSGPLVASDPFLLLRYGLRTILALCLLMLYLAMLGPMGIRSVGFTFHHERWALCCWISAVPGTTNVPWLSGRASELLRGWCCISGGRCALRATRLVCETPLHVVAQSVMLHVSCNISRLSNIMDLKPFVDRLSRILPQSWNLVLAEAQTPRSRIPGDAQLTVSAPDGPTADLLIEAKSRVSARQAAAIGAQWRNARRSVSKDMAGAMVFTRFASKMARTRLREAGVSYLDLTGQYLVDD